MKRYILITVFEREISTERYDTLEEAQKELKNRLFIDEGVKEAFDEKCYTYDEETRTYCGDGWELAPMYAWCNGRRGNWDAVIESLY